MARYAMKVRTAKSPADAFAYMADLSNFVLWDPGVIGATQAIGDTPDLGSAYDVEVKRIGGSMTLRYELTEFEPPHRFVARAESDKLTSVDIITVEADEVGDDEEGSVVTYDAELSLNGAIAIGDPALQLAFNNIGDKAAAGLIRALDGVRVEV